MNHIWFGCSVPMMETEIKHQSLNTLRLWQWRSNFYNALKPSICLDYRCWHGTLLFCFKLNITNQTDLWLKTRKWNFNRTCLITWTCETKISKELSFEINKVKKVYEIFLAGVKMNVIWIILCSFGTTYWFNTYNWTRS